MKYYIHFDWSQRSKTSLMEQSKRFEITLLTLTQKQILINKIINNKKHNLIQMYIIEYKFIVTLKAREK